MQNKSIRRNVIPATAILANTTTVSQIEQSTWGQGIRLYVTVSSATTTGGIDSISLCAVPPGSPTPIPLVGFADVSALSVNGVYIADFYPSAWLPATLAAGGKLLGAAGIYLPSMWAVQIVLAVGSVATITVDAEILP